MSTPSRARGPRLVALIAVLVVVLSSCSDDGSSSSDSTTSTAATGEGSDDLLMVLGAASAQFDGTGDATTLTLRGVDDQTVYFADRPNRQAGSWETTSFVERLLPASYEGEGPPNAALVWQEDGEDRTVIVELGSGTLDADTVSFPVTVLDDEPESLSGFGPPSDLPDHPVGPVWLYIDSVKDSWDGRESCEIIIDNQSSTAFTLSRNTGLWGDTSGSLPTTLDPLSTATYTTDYSSVEANECWGTIVYAAADGTEVAYTYEDVALDDNVYSFYCDEAYSCFNVNFSDSDLLGNHLYICNPGNICAPGDPAELPVGTVPAPPDTSAVNGQITD